MALHDLRRVLKRHGLGFAPFSICQLKLLKTWIILLEDRVDRGYVVDVLSYCNYGTGCSFTADAVTMLGHRVRLKRGRGVLRRFYLFLTWSGA